MRTLICPGSFLAVGVCATMFACSRDKPSGSGNNDMMAGSPSAMSGMEKTRGDNSIAFTAAQIAHGRIRWETVGQSSMSGVVEAPGQLVANDDRTARLAAPAQARVLAVHVSPGDRVATGARLVTLQSPDASMAQSDLQKAQAEVASQRAAATYARSARDRAERLLALKAIPRQDYERAVADDELARASLAQAVAELQRSRSNASQLGIDVRSGTMTLRSPISGVVITREAAPGVVVAPGAPLVTVTDPATLWLVVSLPEAVASGARTGAALRFTVPIAQDTFVARIQSVSASFDPATRSLPVRGLVSNPGGRLRPEMFARVWIESGESQRSITVPESAIQRVENRVTVFVYHSEPNGGARFEKRQVDIGGSVGGRVAVLRGLSAGEAVVVDGAYAVKAEMEKGKMPAEEP
jgi:cobalt-zinc-cadmium efflux system membrane fusion protein